MPFLPFIDLFWLANESSLKEVPPLSKSGEVLMERKESFEPSLEIKPFVLEGSVENFDPVARAEELAQTLARKWCGSYTSFSSKSTIDVIIKWSKVSPVGQIVVLDGEMLIGNLTTKVHGSLNAKSDQLELIPIANKLTDDLESGGIFVGLQGASIFSWKASRLDNPGGKLVIEKQCIKNPLKSEAPPITSVW